jgi:hypothetical protein
VDFEGYLLGGICGADSAEGCGVLVDVLKTDQTGIGGCLCTGGFRDICHVDHK